MKFRKFIILIVFCTILGAGMIVILFLKSNKEIHRNNSFVRSLPPHPVQELKSLDLGFNSYYIAGMDLDTIYLGNTTTPLILTKISLKNYRKILTKVHIDETDLPYRSIQLEVTPPYFFVSDGTIPIIFRGKISDWKATTQLRGVAYFSICKPLDSMQFGIRTVSDSTNEQVLGILTSYQNIALKLSKNLLKKQVDGFFDVDGQLLWNNSLNRLIYIYFYRNKYIIFDKDLQIDYIGKTIDTIQFTKMEVAALKNGQRKMTGNPIRVNRNGTTSGNLLFINSERLGKYEPDKMLKDASIIDVYSLMNREYKFSFYLFHKNGSHVNSMYGFRDLLAIIIDKNLYIYRIKEKYYKEY